MASKSVIKAGFADRMIADNKVCDPAITIAGSQTIADLIAICDHMETSLKAYGQASLVNQ